MDSLIPSDSQIIDAVRAGDSRKFAVLVDRYKDRAFTLAVRMVGDRHQAEEVVQDGFLRAYRGLENFRGDARFSTWFHRIIYNLCLTAIARKKSRQEHLPISDESDLERACVDMEEPLPDEHVEEEEYRQAVAAELEKLPEKFKVLLTLFYVQQLSYEEICRVQDLPLGTVKTNLFRGRNLLKRQVLKSLESEPRIA